MAAIGEPALRCELDDVGERLVQSFVGEPEVQLADARVVDHDAAAGEQHELAPGRRVPSGAVDGDLSGGEDLLAHECVDECRLPDSGRTDQRAGGARCQERPDLVETEPSACRHDCDRHPTGDLGEIPGNACCVRLEVGLQEENRRPCTALPGVREVALEQPRGSGRPRAKR